MSLQPGASSHAPNYEPAVGMSAGTSGSRQIMMQSSAVRFDFWSVPVLDSRVLDECSRASETDRREEMYDTPEV